MFSDHQYFSVCTDLILVTFSKQKIMALDGAVAKNNYFVGVKIKRSKSF